MLLMGMEMLLPLTTPMVQTIDVERDVQGHSGILCSQFLVNKGEGKSFGIIAAVSITVGNVIPYYFHRPTSATANASRPPQRR